jgi:hypothetical protein
LNNREWQWRARCVDGGPDFFDKSEEAVAIAKAFCEPCPVRAECLEFAIVEVDGGCSEKIALDRGVWGGMDGGERVRIRRARANATREGLNG